MWAQSDLNDKRANSIAVSEADLLSVYVLYLSNKSIKVALSILKDEVFVMAVRELIIWEPILPGVSVKRLAYYLGRIERFCPENYIAQTIILLFGFISLFVFYLFSI